MLPKSGTIEKDINAIHTIAYGAEPESVNKSIVILSAANGAKYRCTLIPGRRQQSELSFAGQTSRSRCSVRNASRIDTDSVKEARFRSPLLSGPATTFTEKYKVISGCVGAGESDQRRQDASCWHRLGSVLVLRWTVTELSGLSND